MTYNYIDPTCMVQARHMAATLFRKCVARHIKRLPPQVRSPTAPLLASM